MEVCSLAAACQQRKLSGPWLAATSGDGICREAQWRTGRGKAGPKLTNQLPSPALLGNVSCSTFGVAQTEKSAQVGMAARHCLALQMMRWQQLLLKIWLPRRQLLLYGVNIWAFLGCLSECLCVGISYGDAAPAEVGGSSQLDEMLFSSLWLSGSCCFALAAVAMA